jgi:hypothetical protein
MHLGDYGENVTSRHADGACPFLAVVDAFINVLDPHGVNIVLIIDPGTPIHQRCILWLVLCSPFS